MSGADKATLAALSLGTVDLSIIYAVDYVRIHEDVGGTNNDILAVRTAQAGVMPSFNSLVQVTSPPAAPTGWILGYDSADATPKVKAFAANQIITATGHLRTTADIGKPIVGPTGAGTGWTVLDDTAIEYPTGILRSVPSAGNTLVLARAGDVLTIPIALLAGGFSIATHGVADNHAGNTYRCLWVGAASRDLAANNLHGQRPGRLAELHITPQLLPLVVGGHAAGGGRRLSSSRQAPARPT
jgi:hypothetical protein